MQRQRYDNPMESVNGFTRSLAIIYINATKYPLNCYWSIANSRGHKERRPCANWHWTPYLNSARPPHDNYNDAAFINMVANDVPGLDRCFTVILWCDRCYCRITGRRTVVVHGIHQSNVRTHRRSEWPCKYRCNNTNELFQIHQIQCTKLPSPPQTESPSSPSAASCKKIETLDGACGFWRYANPSQTLSNENYGRLAIEWVAL